MLRVIKVIRLSGCVSSSFKALERESKPRKSGEKWIVEERRKKKKDKLLDDDGFFFALERET